MKKVLITESDFDRLVKRILSESSIIPPFLKTIISNMDLAINGRVNQQIDVLMKKGEIDNFIIVNNVRGKITRPQQILDNLEYLTSKDQKKVFDVIFKNTEDPKLLYTSFKLLKIFSVLHIKGKHILSYFQCS